MPDHQPTGMTNSLGVILTVGMVANGESMQIVQPMGTTNDSLDGTTQCKDAVKSWEAHCAATFQGIYSVDAYISFIQAEGMVNGAIPWRDVFANTVYPGNRDANAAPTNVAALISYYADPDDLGFGESRMKIAKTFIGGIASDDVGENKLNSEVTDAMAAYAILMVGGFPSDAGGSGSWYRVLNTPNPRTAGTALKRIFQPEPRGYVYTQKRRLLPRI